MAVDGVGDDQGGMNPRGPGKKKRMSEAQMMAQRRNAKASTGPRSEAGKHRSSRNATIHGGYAQDANPIPRGEFAEPREEFEAYLNGIIQANHPRDAIEFATTKNIAMVYRKFERLDAFEAELIAGAGRIEPEDWTMLMAPREHAEYLEALEHPVPGGSPPQPPQVWSGTYRDASQLHADVESLFLFLSGEDDGAEDDEDGEEDPDYWERLARFVREEKGKGRTVIPDRWDKHTVPETWQQWRHVLIRLVDHYWPDRDDGIRWTNTFITTTIPRRSAAVVRMREISAQRIGDGVLERVTRLRGQLARELNVHLGVLANLKKRDLGERGSAPDETNPNSPANQ
jgi:hypothetical protein